MRNLYQHGLRTIPTASSPVDSASNLHPFGYAPYMLHGPCNTTDTDWFVSNLRNPLLGGYT
jgi:hypothetical protein